MFVCVYVDFGRSISLCDAERGIEILCVTELDDFPLLHSTATVVRGILCVCVREKELEMRARVERAQEGDHCGTVGSAYFVFPDLNAHTGPTEAP